MRCPKCGSEKIVIRTKGGSTCCGGERYTCSDCQFSAPKRVFIEGLPSKKGR